MCYQHFFSCRFKTQHHADWVKNVNCSQTQYRDSCTSFLTSVYFFIVLNELLCSLHNSVSGMYHTNNVHALLTVISNFSYNWSTVSPGNSVTYHFWDCHSVTRFIFVLCVITNLPVVCPLPCNKQWQRISLIFGGRPRWALLRLELLCILKGQMCAGKFSVLRTVPQEWALHVSSPN